MEIIKTSTLNEKQIDDINELEEKCSETDGDSLLVYKDEGDNIYPDFDCFYMLYEGDDLLSFLSVFQPDGYCPYVYAMTHPEHRKKGYFSQLYECFLDELGFFKFESVSFPLSPDNTIAPDIIKSMGGFESKTEYILSYDLAKHKKNEDNTLTLTSTTNEDGSITYYMQDYALKRFKRTIGSLIITPDDKIVCLSDFEISKSKRNRGYGRTMLNLLCEDLINKHYEKILLQVSSTNPNAFHLYESFGFIKSSCLKYYNIDYPQKI